MFTVEEKQTIRNAMQLLLDKNQTARDYQRMRIETAIDLNIPYITNHERKVMSQLLNDARQIRTILEKIQNA